MTETKFLSLFLFTDWQSNVLYSAFASSASATRSTRRCISPNRKQAEQIGLLEERFGLVKVFIFLFDNWSKYFF